MAEGFVLPLEDASSSEPQTMPPLPGLWTPDVPVHPATLGLTHDDVNAAIADWGLPLLTATVEEPPADALDRTAGMISGASDDSSLPEGRPREASDVPGLTPAEVADRDVYDAYVEGQGTEIPDGPVVDDGGVTVGMAARLRGPGPAEPVSATAKLDALTLAELRDLAESNSVDLGDATRKDEVVAVLHGAGVVPGGGS